MENTHKSFNEIFPDIIFDDSSKILKNSIIQKINIYKKSKKIELDLNIENVISPICVFNLEEVLLTRFGLSHAVIDIKYTGNPLSYEEILCRKQEMLEFLNLKFPITRAIFLESTWEINNGILYIKLKNVGREILQSKKCDIVLKNIIKNYFGKPIEVEFIDGVGAEQDEHQNVLKEMQQYQSNEVKKVLETNTIVQKTKKEQSGKTNPQDLGVISNLICGKEFKEGVSKIKGLSDESGKVAIEGKVLAKTSREIKGGKYILTFDICDFTSSITCKMFLDKNKYEAIEPRVIENNWVRVLGDVQYDKFSRELSVFVVSILEVEKQQRKDLSEEKRIELHLHTQMSSMDGVSPAKDLVKRAAYWGHSAVAITDHGVCQAYPEAFEAGKKNNVKILYGVEAYLVNDAVPIVYDAKDQMIDTTYIILDIETTGLSASADKITEVCFAKYINGEIVDTLESFVNPEVPIPSFIQKLTGITDDMVADAPKIEELMPKIIDFIGDSVLVAHNASFDMGFLRHFAKLCDLKITNTVLDTLQLSRTILHELSKHKLGIIAKHLNIEVEVAHRAIDDVKTLAKVFTILIDKVKAKEIIKLEHINNLVGSKDIKKADSYHAVILVKNNTGLKNLYKIISQAHLKYYYKKPRTPKSLYTKYKEGLMIGTACEAGELYRAILDDKDEQYISKLIQFYDYLEIQPLGNNKFLLDTGRIASEEELKEINRKIVKLAKKFKKPVVATGDVHFLDPWDEVYRRILMAGQGFSDADNQAPLYFKTTDEMLKEFSYLGKETAHEVVIDNPKLISDMIEANIEPIPQKTYPPKIEGAEEEIERLAMGKAKEIYGDPLPEVVKLRLEKELNSIIKNGFSVMYIIAQKLVWKSLADGYLVGSRGSVGSSFVATMSGITEVNPLPAHYICKNQECRYSEFPQNVLICGCDLPPKVCPKCGQELKRDGYDIPFETFLGFDGDKEPDIDLNFSGDYQPRAHKYTEELFGEGHVFRAGTIGTIADKTAYGFVKKYMDDRGQVAYMAEVNRLVSGCTGVKRTTGQHPGGVMIVPSDKEIYDFCPIQHPADDTDTHIITTHFDYHSIHGTLLKLDILGHDDPTVIRMLEDLTGLDATEIPIGDSKTMELFLNTNQLGITKESINSEVGTFAIPEFGTKFVRQMLIDTKPKTFSELIRISGLSHGTDVWLNNAQELIRAGTAKLADVICTRDDIMLYLISKNLPPKTAFKIMEDVRKGKGIKEEYEEVMKQNDVPAWYIESCKRIKYMFPKAHAAAYVMMAFRIAYFKVYYPEAFYTAYFTVRADDFDATMMTNGVDRVKRHIKELEEKGNEISTKEKGVLTILEVANEMYERGIKFLPIDLYHSDWEKFKIEESGILPPLNALQGLGTVAAKSICEARKDGEFTSIDELRIRAKISKSVIEILQQNGVLSGMPESNQMSLF